MEELQINWRQEKPDPSEFPEIWASIKLTPLHNWTKATEVLKEKISHTHCNGGIQLHKYKIEGNKQFDWFATRNRLEEIEFVKYILRHKDLQNYRDDLEISEDKPKFKLVKYWTDIYDLPGELTRIMAHGGAYKKILPQLAWNVATEFVKEEFENRFEEFSTFKIAVDSAKWFHDIAWDYSILLFDQRKYELVFIDITDTD